MCLLCCTLGLILCMASWHLLGLNLFSVSLPPRSLSLRSASPLPLVLAHLSSSASPRPHPLPCFSALPGVVLCVASGPVLVSGAPPACSAPDYGALGVGPLFPGCSCPVGCGLSFLFCPG